MSGSSLVCIAEFSYLLHEHLYFPVLAGTDYSIDEFGDEDETGVVPLVVLPGTGSAWTIARVSEWRNKVILATGKRWPNLDEIFEWILMEEPTLPEGYAWGIAGEPECRLCETLVLMSLASDPAFEWAEGQWRLKYMTDRSMCHECEKEWHS